jgi:hypothetical protein
MKIYGYSNCNDWIAMRIKPPPAKQGILLFDTGDALPYGSSMISPVYCNPINRWTCIGDPFQQGEAVEFMFGCIAILDRDHQLIALWIRIDESPLIFTPPSHKYHYQGKNNPLNYSGTQKTSRLIWKWKGELAGMEAPEVAQE